MKVLPESLFEGNTVDKSRILQSATGDLLDTNHLERHDILINGLDSRNDHFGEELFVGSDELKYSTDVRRIKNKIPLSSWLSGRT